MCRESAKELIDILSEEDLITLIELGDMVLGAIRERRISAPDGWDHSCRREGILFYPHEDIISKGATITHDDGSPPPEPREYTLFGVLILDTPIQSASTLGCSAAMDRIRGIASTSAARCQDGSRSEKWFREIYDLTLTEAHKHPEDNPFCKGDARLEVQFVTHHKDE